MKRTGRPPKPADIRHNDLIQIRVTKPDGAKIRKAAGGKGNVSAWGRRILLRATRTG